MYYLKPDESGKCTVYGYEPEEPYLEVEELPATLPFKQNYEQPIFTDLKTAWREYVRIIPDETQRKIQELEQVVADLASLQLEVLMNG